MALIFGMIHPKIKNLISIEIVSNKLLFLERKCTRTACRIAYTLQPDSRKSKNSCICHLGFFTQHKVINLETTK